MLDLHNKKPYKKYNLFKEFSFYIAVILVTRTFLPIVNVLISGIIFDFIFLLWLFISLIAYKDDFKVGWIELYLYLFPIFFVLYVLICNTIANGKIYTEDFIVYFNFCIPIYMYLVYSQSDKRALYKLSILLLIFMTITSITTIYHLNTNFYYSKLLSSTNVDTFELWIKNIANINFICSCIILIPFLFYTIINTKKSKISRIFIGLLILLYFIMVYKASFSIITLCVLLGIVLVIFNNKYMVVCNIIMLLTFFILKNDISLFLIDISQHFNVLYSQRIVEIALFLRGDAAQGDLFGRLFVYNKSIQFFLNHPLLGIGTGEYFNRTGILGYHSEFFDSMARYGLIMFIPIFIYFKLSFKKILISKYEIMHKKIIYTSIALFIIYSFFNTSFASYTFSSAAFILVPSIEFYIGEKKKGNENFDIITR